MCDFYAEGWKEVEILFHFDLSPALNSIPRSRLLSKLEPLVTDKYVFHLLSALPILDEDGRDWSIDVGGQFVPLESMGWLLPPMFRS